jgi:DNA-binding response OmpR family regulator
MSERRRVIVAMADAFEGAAVYDGLSADGFEPVWHSTVRAAADEMRARPFDLLITDAAFALSGGLQSESRPRNPLTPTILIGDAGAPHLSSNSRAMYLTRPVDRAMLTCFVTMAFLQDKPIRRSVRKPVNRFQALVNGAPAYILDVSAEGLRLEMPGERTSALPPFFTVRVPIVDLAFTVQRMWTRSASTRAPAVWYGGALSQNQTRVAQAWRSFVDKFPVTSEDSVTLVR